MKSNKALLYIFSALISSGLHSICMGAVVLEINISDPSAVTVTSTGAASSIDFSDSGQNRIDLLDFFTSDPGRNINQDPASGSSSLADKDGNILDSMTVSSSLKKLLFHSDNDLSYMNGEAAFSGSATFDMSSISTSALPTVGMTGDVTPPNYGSTVIGQWSVVPEPSVYTSAAGIAGLLAVLFVRRRKR